MPEAKTVKLMHDAINECFTMSSEQKINSSIDALFLKARLNEQSMPQSTLYIVGLPIGNTADISLRALWTLQCSDAIACEDTRETKKLLERYGIETPLIAVHKFNEKEASLALIERLKKGEKIALVTDAGTPAVSDPGAIAVKEVREAGFAVVPIPGACAAVCAMSGAGLSAYGFSFAGFLPPNAKARDERLAVLLARREAFILYEAPHRVMDLLKAMVRLGEPSRRIVVTRELTKKFESFYDLRLEALPDWMKTHDPKGEYVILVDESKESAACLDEETLKWARAIGKELPLSRTAALVARVTGLKRDDVYQALVGK